MSREQPPSSPLRKGGAATGAGASATRWWTLTVVTLATFMLLLDLTVVNVALPNLRRSLHADFTGLQWVLDAYALTLAVFLLTGGSLADRLGRRRVFNVGFFVFSAASLACGLAGNIAVLNVSRGVQGAGAAVLFAVGPALIGQEFHGKERGAAFGVFGAGSGLAIALGPLIGGALTDGLGWRWIFLVNVPIGVIALAVSALRIPESRDLTSHGVDWSGLVVFSAALSLIVFALLRGEAEGWSSGLILGAFVLGALALVAFLLIERSKGERAMLDLRLFRIPTFNGISVAALIYPAVNMSAVFLVVAYLQNVLHYSPWATGVRYLPLTLVLFVMAALAGGMTTKMPLRLLIGLGGLFLAAGLAAVRLWVHADSGWTALLPSMVLCGIGLGIFNPPRAFLSIGIVEPRKAGMASGINETFQQVGIALGIAAFGALYQARVSDSFAHSAAGASLGGAARHTGDAVASGAIPSGQLAGAARAAVVTGLGDTMLVGAAFAAVGAILALLLIRSSDLHESAKSAQPGVLPDVEVTETPAAVAVEPASA